jgi:nicotinate-nucleotide pyrophosphorylase (carboxylating)
MIRNSKRVCHPSFAVIDAVAAALDEDRAGEDVTTLWTVPAEARARAVVEARVAGTIAGVHVAAEVFRQIDPEVSVQPLVDDSARVARGDRVLEIAGSARSILTGERVMLNFLQRLSGIATAATNYVAQVADLPVKILDTRKTAPGLRLLDKYAVACGGATNHRRDLRAMVLVKENHLAVAGGVAPAVHAVQQRLPERQRHLQVEVEVTSVGQALEALDCGVDWVLLDNMALDDMRAVVRARNLRPAWRAVQLEASGNVDLASVRSIALCGVDAISVGALTHSPAALDLSLLVLCEALRPTRRTISSTDAALDMPAARAG